MIPETSTLIKSDAVQAAVVAVSASDGLNSFQTLVLGVLRSGGVVHRDRLGRYRLYSDGFCWVRSLYPRTVAALVDRGLIRVGFQSNNLTVWRVNGD